MNKLYIVTCDAGFCGTSTAETISASDYKAAETMARELWASNYEDYAQDEDPDFEPEADFTLIEATPEAVGSWFPIVLDWGLWDYGFWNEWIATYGELPEVIQNYAMQEIRSGILTLNKRMEYLTAEIQKLQESMIYCEKQISELEGQTVKRFLTGSD